LQQDYFVRLAESRPARSAVASRCHRPYVDADNKMVSRPVYHCHRVALNAILSLSCQRTGWQAIYVDCSLVAPPREFLFTWLVSCPSSRRACALSLS